MGHDALLHLQKALESPATSPQVRDQIPRCISQFGTEQAAAYLLEALAAPISARLAQRVVRELERMRCIDPDLRLSPVALHAAIGRILRRGFEVVRWRAILTRGAAADRRRATAVHGLLIRMLRDKEVWIVDVLLRLVGILLPGRDVDRMRVGFRSTDLALWSSSFELLESTLPSELRAPTLALIEAVGDRAGREGEAGQGGVGGIDYEAVLRQLAADESQTLSELAERQLVSLGTRTGHPAKGAGLSDREGGLEATRTEAWHA